VRSRHSDTRRSSPRYAVPTVTHGRSVMAALAALAGASGCLSWFMQQSPDSVLSAKSLQIRTSLHETTRTTIYFRSTER
jgi:hypothetical protein